MPRMRLRLFTIPVHWTHPSAGYAAFSSPMFDPVDPKQNLPALEKGILRYWQEEDIFKRSVHQRGSAEHYSFYDGPPFVTGLPHYGHLLAGAIKDVIPRYRTMRGDRVERRFGWDCHGLPVEALIEQENGIRSHQEIEEMGTKKFNDLCRASVQRYCGEWRTTVERMGRWVDMDWDYRTMDPDYMESVWWVFGALWKKKLVYEGHKPMHVCPRCATPLSNFEVTQGYKDVTDVTVTAKFELKAGSGRREALRQSSRQTGSNKEYMLAWTTTPWTLPGNLFLAVDPKMTYVQVRTEQDGTVILSKEVFEHSKEKHSEWKALSTLKGKELVGKRYEPLFPYFAERYGEKAFKVIAGDFVAAEEGTGIVHVAPGFGEDDYNAGRTEGVDVLQHVTMDGTFTADVTDFAGVHVKPSDDPGKTDRKIIAWLKERGKVFSSETVRHSYPHCWRCDAPLLNYATSSWFVKVEQMRERLLACNAETAWVPAHIRDGRFGKWLGNARDWAISRNRYWGTPLPIWRTADGGEIVVIGGRDELMQRRKIRFTKITVLRHAESEGNLIPIYQGKTPGTDLTALGKRQAKAAGMWLNDGAGSGEREAGSGVTVVYTSPLARTLQTAQIIAKETGASVIEDERLREVNFGKYEGTTADFTDLTLVRERRAHKLGKKKPESIYHFDGMETWASVQERIDDFLRDVLPQHRGGHIVLVTHADPFTNIRHFFTKEDPVKLSLQPYPKKASPTVYFWDHDREAQLDLHKDTVDDIVWPGDPSEKSVAVILVRHGETDWNREKKSQGCRSDQPMNETGRAQARALAAALKAKDYDCIVSSPLKRATETAQILSDALGVPFTERLSGLRERDTGAWNGRNVDELRKETGAPSTTFHYRTPEGGERLSDFLARVQEAMAAILEKYPGKRVIVVSHGGTTRAFRALAENLTYAEAVAFTPANASVECTLRLDPPLRRVREVLDCWFESGSMPYAQAHHPFAFRPSDQKTTLKNGKPVGFPADFIAENLDQTRGWFYTLLVLSTALFDEPAFRNCICGGMILAEDGKKMSKRLKNYPDPSAVMEKFGADALRWALMSSPVVRAEELRFSERTVQSAVQNVLLPLWNAYGFFVTYANAAVFEPAETRRRSDHPLDRWIRAEVQDLANRMTEELDRYDLSATCAQLGDTIDALTNWYIRLSRRRFAARGPADAPEPFGDAEEGDRRNALATLYDVLLTLSQILAPLCPFVTDAIYLNLVPAPHGSVHLTDWPETRDLTEEERRLIAKNRFMRRIVSLGHNVRSTAKVKVRQPLESATVAIPLSPVLPTRPRAGLPQTAKDFFTEQDISLLRQELNVKTMAFADAAEEFADSYVQIDARKVGPRLGSRVQEIIEAGKRGEFAVHTNGTIAIQDELFGPDEAQVLYRAREGENVAADQGIVVSIHTEITDELKCEGAARDLIRAIQKLRKEAGLRFTDRIRLEIAGADGVLGTHGEMIARETRAEFGENDGQKHAVDLDGARVTLQFEKV